MCSSTKQTEVNVAMIWLWLVSCAGLYVCKGLTDHTGLSFLFFFFGGVGVEITN